ncbi:MAG: PTS glucose transporter subunit IIA [Lachnospiraceae bacterium]
MGLFGKLFGKEESGIITAPVSGKLVSIKEVNDPTFSEEILGKGVAIIPSDNQICAPATGTVTTVFPTGHAAALTTDDGAEILIHIGLDTVKLDGKHFTIHVSEGQKVSKGDLLLEADLEQIKAEGYDTITPIIICNSDDFSEISPADFQDVKQGETVLTLRK